VRQLLSDTLAAYAASPEIEPPPARSVIGPANARLEITEFFDTLCSHCAQLHETLLQLRQRLGPDAFSLAPHHYPLDPSCNPSVQREDSDPLHCIAARAHICAEGRPGALELSSELFHQQRSLTEPIILAAAEKVVPEAELETCMASPETAAKLAADVAWATAQGVRGTPFLLIGRKKALPFPPLIYALALTRGAASHPAFAALPAPQPLPEALR
jgi:protein-disulfide isomerase